MDGVDRKRREQQHQLNREPNHRPKPHNAHHNDRGRQGDHQHIVEVVNSKTLGDIEWTVDQLQRHHQHQQHRDQNH